MARLLPFTVRIAPDAVNGALPRAVFPSEKAMLPVGKEIPLAARTVAMSCVAAVDAITGGRATADVVVATDAAETVTVAEPPELEKFPVAV